MWVWGIIISAVLTVASLAFLVAYQRRIRPLPLSRRSQDRRARYYYLCFLALSATWAIVQVIFAFLTRPH
jgi:hypothetical protein